MLTRIPARVFAAAVFCLVAGTTSCVSASRQSSESNGARIYDYRRQSATTVAFLAADTPFIRVRAYTPDDTGVFSTKAITLLKNGGLAIGVAHSSMNVKQPPADVRSYSGNGSGQVALAGSPQSSVSAMIPTPFTRFRTMDVRLFDAMGKYVGRLGGSGENRGQFTSSPHYINERSNGEILVTTIRPAITGFTPGGEVVRAVGFDFDRRGTLNAGMLADQSIVVGVEQKTVNVSVDATGALVQRTEFLYALHDMNGMKVRDLPFVRNFHFISGGPGRPPAPESPWPYDAIDQVVAGGDNIWLFDPIKWELKNFDRKGILISITRPEIPKRLHNAVLGQRVEGRASNAKVMADDEGNLWMDAGVDRNPTPLNFDRQVWTVYDKTGKMRGAVVLPVGLWLLSVQRSSLLGIYRESPDPTSRVMVAGFKVRDMTVR